MSNPGPKYTLVERLERNHRVTDDGCWEWTLSDDTHGYGQISVGSRLDGTKTTQKVHRVAWWAFRGEIPEGMDLDHVCRNRRCFNPDHLRPCTRRENLLAPGSRSPSAIHAAATHCAHGHPLSGENLYVRPRGSRECRTCRREQKQRWDERHRPIALI